MAACDATIGGQFVIRLGDAVFECLGDAEIKPARVSRAAGASANGRLWTTVEAKPATASFTLANFRGESDPMLLWNAQCGLDITFKETDTGTTHYFSNASVVGDVAINPGNGEVSGMEIATDKYSKT